MLYVQHLLGIGHLRRAALIARALDAAGLRTVLVSGGEPLQNLQIGDAEYVQLPPVRAADASFSELVDQNDAPIDDKWREQRAAVLREIFEKAAPDCLITELFPFGRRQFAFELMPLLETARSGKPPPLILSSVRDILVAPAKPGRVEEAIGRAKSYYDHVLVHGDPAFAGIEESYPAITGISDKLVYTGFVANGQTDRLDDGGARPPGQDEILISAGGGVVGNLLMHTALAARAFSSRAGDKSWRFLIGPNAPDKMLDELRAKAPAGCIVEPARDDFPQMLRHCAASVSQAGYNTVMDIFRARIPSVLVPFAAGNETEQTMRAELTAKRGLATHVRESELTPQALAAALDGVLDSPPPIGEYPRLDGAQETARWIMARLTDG